MKISQTWPPQLAPMAPAPAPALPLPPPLARPLALPLAPPLALPLAPPSLPGGSQLAKSKTTFPNLPLSSIIRVSLKKIGVASVGALAFSCHVHMYRLPVVYFITHGGSINQCLVLLELKRLH